VVLGEISFAMYMLHQIFLRAFGTYGLQAPEGMAWPAFGLFSVFMVALSYGVWVLLERPARRLLNQLLRRSRLAA
jgi:peptidoglycan/LPS O-acetylase OafA/YrhL